MYIFEKLYKLQLVGTFIGDRLKKFQFRQQF